MKWEKTQEFIKLLFRRLVDDGEIWYFFTFLWDAIPFWGKFLFGLLLLQFYRAYNTVLRRSRSQRYVKPSSRSFVILFCQEFVIKQYCISQGSHQIHRRGQCFRLRCCATHRSPRVRPHHDLVLWVRVGENCESALPGTGRG